MHGKLITAITVAALFAPATAFAGDVSDTSPAMSNLDASACGQYPCPPAPPAPGPLSGVLPVLTSGGTPTPAAAVKPVTKKTKTKSPRSGRLPASAKGGKNPTSGKLPASANGAGPVTVRPGTGLKGLPFTGLDLMLVVIIALLLIALGAVLRAAARTRTRLAAPGR